MHAIRRKLQSRRGASLTFALLLFMVCAVIGSLVLVAGTAAAGRLKGLGESEQRFHAVNSAAELIVDQLCGDDNKVTVGIKKLKDTSAAADPDDPYTYEYILPANDSKASDLAEDLAKYLVFGTANLSSTDDKTVMKPYYEFCEEGKFHEKFSFEVKAQNGSGEGGGGTDNDEIPDVTVEADFLNGFQLNLKVTAGEGANSYTLPIIILETSSPRGSNTEDRIEYTFVWKAAKG